MKPTGWLFALAFIMLMFVQPVTAMPRVAWNDQEFMSVREIYPGMTGYGKTVFEGTTISTFDVVVVGVLRHIDFGFDMILIRVTSGPVVDRHLQTVEGMSGSPIYIDGRLIGAYAYGWDFQQEPIAGVTPIEAMLESSEAGSAAPPLSGTLAPKDGVLQVGNQLITQVKVANSDADAQKLHSGDAPTTMVMSPVATPVFTNGFSDKALKPLQQLLSRYNLRQAAGPGSMPGPAPALEAGSAIAVSLMTGDADLSAVGTVTYAKGDTLLIFGHPFMGKGEINMPIAPAYVHGIVSSAEASFKLASPMGQVGTAILDRNYGVTCDLSQQPNTIPVQLYLKDPHRDFDKRYQAQVITDPQLTPMILYLYVLSSGAGQLGDITADPGTFAAHTVISTDRLGDIAQDLVVSPEANTGLMPMSEFYLLADLLMQNPYEPVKINKAYIDMTYTPGRNIATIEKVTLDRPVARPGDTVNVHVRIRPYGKPVEEKDLQVVVPQYTTEPVMAIVVAGGTNGAMLKSLVTPAPTAEEGVRGLVRWLTDTPPSQSLIIARMFPTPSYGYRGRILRDIPDPVVDLLRFSEFAGITTPSQLESGVQSSTAHTGQAPDPWAEENLRPTTYLDSQPVPYLLTGGQAVLIAIQTEEQSVQSGYDNLGSGFEIPVLSSSQDSSDDNYAPGDEVPPPDDAYGGVASAAWFTADQQIRHRILLDAFQDTALQKSRLVLPRLVFKHAPAQEPLSQSLGTGLARPASDVTADPAPAPAPAGSGATAPASSSSGTPDLGATEEIPLGDTGSDTGAAPEEDPVLLSSHDYSWDLQSRGDFLHGKHLGTGVNAKGELSLVPAVSVVSTLKTLVPWKLVATADGAYVAGWGSADVMRLPAQGAGEPVRVFPANPADAGTALAVTALAADAVGNLLIGLWPDQTVLLVKPADGSVLRTWHLPSAVTWDLAVATNGKIYAACDDGTMYGFDENVGSHVFIAAKVPDKIVYTLAAGKNGTMYLATAPRGKVYHLDADGEMQSTFEGDSAVSSLLVEDDGTVYVGTTSDCTVIRVSPDGRRQTIFTHQGLHENHVLGLRRVGDDLYACTGPGGGIYRIQNPRGDEQDITAIFAREDVREGLDEAAPVGPESVMVNALAVAPGGDLLAASSSPAQVLRVQRRAQGAFLSSVQNTPSVAHWGNVEIHDSVAPDQALITESRSGLTALPDATWSDWVPIRKIANQTPATDQPNELQLASPPAPYVQLRVRMVASATGAPTLDYIKVHYRPLNNPPHVDIDTPKAGDFWKGEQEVRWEGSDPDGDKLVYTVSVSSDGGKTWSQISQKLEEEPKGTKPEKPDTGTQPAGGTASTTGQPTPQAGGKPAATPGQAPAPAGAAPRDSGPGTGNTPVSDTGADNGATKPTPKPGTGDANATPATPPKAHEPPHKETHETSITWDSKTVPDGVYILKVVASDKYARPDDPKSAEIISGQFTVDNTPPTIVAPERVAAWSDIAKLEVTDNLTPIRGGRYCVDDGPWTAVVPVDGIFHTKDEWFTLLGADGSVTLTAGSHKVDIQIEDSAGNMAEKTINVGEVPPPPTPPVTTVTPPVTPPATPTPPPVSSLTPPSPTSPALTAPTATPAEGDSTGLADLMWYSLQKSK